MGVLARLASRLGRTRAVIGDGISGLFHGGRKIAAELMGELEELLWTSDLGPIAGELCEELARLPRRGELHGESDVRAHLRSLLAERLDVAPPQVAELATDVTGSAAAGLAVTLHTDARYASSPSPLKVALLVAHLLALAATLAVAVRTWTGTRRVFDAPVRPGPADLVVLVVSCAWAVLGPLNIDDSWYALMARQGARTGTIGNAIYQFDVTEAPFATSQYLLQWWGSLVGWGLGPLRVVPVVLGLLSWLIGILLRPIVGRSR